jgi:hypothetical protein
MVAGDKIVLKSPTVIFGERFVLLCNGQRSLSKTSVF